jgi:hypothetical protein
MYVQPFDGSLTPNALATMAANPETGGTLFPGGPALASGDNISRVQPPWANEGGAADGYGDYSGSGYLQGLLGPLMSVLQQLMQMLQSMMDYGCNGSYGYGGSCPPGGSVSCPPNGNGGCPPSGNERFFRNATGSSDGDPHLSFNGAKWNNMASQPDLLDSNSIAGGFRISTQATAPNAKGATWNQSATVTLNGGATTITMSNNGEASITSYGQSMSIAKGQTLQVGDGESVTYEQNGSLQVTAQNGEGGRIETSLTPEGQGVNVDVTAHDVDLGGTLANGYEGRDHNPAPIEWPNPISNPISGPISSPISNPISGPMPMPVPQPYPPVPQPVGEGSLEPLY